MNLHDAGDMRSCWVSSVRPRNAAAETAVLAFVIPEALLLARPQLAGVLLALMPLIPILLGLRYGFVASTAASLLLTLVMFQFYYFPPHVLKDFPELQALVYLLAGSIAAQFHDYWNRLLDDARASAAQDRLRLTQFTSTFHLLQASHNLLERQLLGNRTSLRTSLQRLKGHLAMSPPDATAPLGGIGAWLLELFAETGNLHAAAAYVINDHRLIAQAPAASYGITTALSPSNPLLREALNSGSVVSLRANDTDVDHVIAVIPLVDSQGRIHGVVSINHMAFFAIRQATFDLMAIIARQVGDILSSHANLLADANDSQVLLDYLRRGIATARLHSLPLAVVGVTIIEPLMQKQLITQCLGVHRAIDQSWLCHDRLDRPVIVMLMPMPTEAAARNKVQRLRDHVAEVCGSEAAAEGMQNFVMMLDGERSAEDALEIMLHACDIDTPLSPMSAHAFDEMT